MLHVLKVPTKEAIQINKDKFILNLYFCQYFSLMAKGGCCLIVFRRNKFTK